VLRQAGFGEAEIAKLQRSKAVRCADAARGTAAGPRAAAANAAAG
jgi:hypothetical protein